MVDYSCDASEIVAGTPVLSGIITIHVYPLITVQVNAETMYYDRWVL